MQSTASISGLPVSRHINVESARSRWRILVATSCSSLAFSTPGVFHQACCACFAAWTAASTSAASASEATSMRSSVAGFQISRVRALWLGTQEPAMRRCLGMD
jgi:hypothetical protein